MIPALLGVIVLILGLLATGDRHRRHAMHVATLLSQLGFISTVGSSADLVALLGGAEVTRAGAVVSKAVMSVLSLAYFIVSLLSFLIARTGDSPSD
jgi:hypothetical protein